MSRVSGILFTLTTHIFTPALLYETSRYHYEEMAAVMIRDR